MLPTDTSQQAETVVAAITRGVIKWRVYYGDGSVARSEDVSWDACEQDHVQVVTQFRLSLSGDRLMAEMQSGDDEYRLEGHDQVKVGQFAPWKVYDAIFSRANQDKLDEFEAYQDERRARGERGN